jgi:hypothetical protein
MKSFNRIEKLVRLNRAISAMKPANYLARFGRQRAPNNEMLPLRVVIMGSFPAAQLILGQLGDSYVASPPVQVTKKPLVPLPNHHLCS